MALRGIAMAKKLRLKKMALFRPLVCILAIANPEEHSEAVYCFHGGEYVYGGHDWLSGKYWRVTLSQSIRYVDGIILAQ